MTVISSCLCVRALIIYIFGCRDWASINLSAPREPRESYTRRSQESNISP